MINIHMEELPAVCSLCGQGNLSSEIITTQSDGNFDQVGYYSCGHRHSQVEVEFTVRRDPIVGTKQKSGNKIRGKPEQEIEDKCDHSDRDHPERPVTNTFYRQRSTDHTSFFHTATYDSGELKHLDCKTEKCGKKCDNGWVNSGEEPLENHFAVEIGKTIHIHCLKCGASFTRP